MVAMFMAMVDVKQGQGLGSQRGSMQEILSCPNLVAYSSCPQAASGCLPIHYRLIPLRDHVMPLLNATVTGWHPIMHDPGACVLLQVLRCFSIACVMLRLPMGSTPGPAAHNRE